MLTALLLLATTGHGALALAGCGVVCGCIGALDVALVPGWRSTGPCRPPHLDASRTNSCGPGVYLTRDTGPL